MTSSTAEQLCRRFSLAEIHSATGDFSDEHVIGKGGFGKVYKALINKSLTVAIKRLASTSNQGEREFVMEMETLTKVRHRNLVSLIGYCDEQGEMILVYEYVTNGTLADHLYQLSRNGFNCPSLTWTDRLKICIGAGRGIDYLHTGSSIIHRDVKPTNILLDENFTAKVADFGLAKHFNADNLESHVSASFKGTLGYVDPSFLATGRLTMASDVYAFGVVLLEVLAGKSALDRVVVNGKQLRMSIWAQQKIRGGKANQIVASDLKGEILEGCLKTFVGVVKRCLHDDPKKRLTMTQVVAQLEFALDQQERKGTTPHKLQFGPFSAFWNRVTSYGPRKGNIEVRVNVLPKATPAIDKDAVEHNQTIDELEKQNVNMQPVEEDELEKEHNSNMQPIEVPAAEILAVTDDFSRNCWIANGSNGGSIFHGVLKTGQVAAIKRLYTKLPDQEFLAQVSTIFSLKHENVVELHGYCGDGGLQVFVYELAPRGSLHDILHGPQGRNGLDLEPSLTLSWLQRIEIAVGAAKGLCYIHEKGLIHHNIKSSNVLLFDDEIAKITDLRLSTGCSCKDCFLYERHPVTLPPCFAYHPPEFKRVGHSQAGDVYSFGIVLHELLTGQEVIFDPRWGMGEDLVTWATTMLSEDMVDEVKDARLQGNYHHEAVGKMGEVAGYCLAEKPKGRPSMITVVRDLQIASRVTQD